MLHSPSAALTGDTHRASSDGDDRRAKTHHFADTAEVGTLRLPSVTFSTHQHRYIGRSTPPIARYIHGDKEMVHFAPASLAPALHLSPSLQTDMRPHDAPSLARSFCQRIGGPAAVFAV